MADAGGDNEQHQAQAALLAALNNLNDALGGLVAANNALVTARDQRSARSRGGWDDEKDHHCDCPVCAALPDGPPDGEPGQDPTTWHWPVATNRQHVVLSRLYHWRDVFSFMRRHEEGLRSPYGLFRASSLDFDDDKGESTTSFSFEGGDTPPPQDTFMHRGVILDLRGETIAPEMLPRSPWATTWASCLLRSSGTDPTASTISESSRESKIVS